MESMPDRPLPRRSPSERIVEWIAWFGVGRLVVVAGSVLAIGAGGFWLLRVPAPPVEASLPFAATSTSTSITSLNATAANPTDLATTIPEAPAGPSVIVVHVAGAVAAPGVHELPADARVVDAVAAAGGLRSDAHADALNLAAPLRDGDRVYVPAIGEVESVPIGVTGTASASASAAQDGSPPVGPVDLNEASLDDLDTLPGVGPATALAIVTHREQQGPFLTIDDLADVRGIGPAKLESLRGLVTV